MLPLRTRLVDVPHEKGLGGFELFADGATASLPGSIGYEGADSIDPARPVDIFLTGRHFSIDETQVIAGERLVEPRAIDIISRRVVRIRIAPGAVGTSVPTGAADDRECVEVRLRRPTASRIRW